MRSILVPTDFSKAADNAAQYAMQMAEFLNARIVLFHAYAVPLLPVEETLATGTWEKMEHAAAHAMKAAENRLQPRSGKVSVEHWLVPGFAVEEILNYTRTHPTDIIVMGMRGAGSVTERLMGSVTTAVIRESTCPVLAVGEHMQFRLPKKLVMACDFKETGSGVLAFLSDFAKTFHSHVHILNIEEKEELPFSEMEETGLDLETALSGIDHTYHEKLNADLVNGINDFVQKEQMDMVVMIPRRHSPIHRLFHEPATKRAAFHSLVPLLTIHE